MWRCLNDPFGYCAGEPWAVSKPVKAYSINIAGKQVEFIGSSTLCELDKRTCGLYLTATEHYLEFLKQMVPGK